MINGPPSVDTYQQMKAPPEFKAPANNFTPFPGDMLRDAQATISQSPESGKVTVTELPKYQEGLTISMSPQDKELTDRLMAQIMDKPKTERLKEVVPQIEKKIPQEKKSQSFFANIWESIRNFFKNLFR